MVSWDGIRERTGKAGTYTEETAAKKTAMALNCMMEDLEML